MHDLMSHTHHFISYAFRVNKVAIVCSNTNRILNTTPPLCVSNCNQVLACNSQVRGVRVLFA